MFVELLEKLRCPLSHADSPLVATSSHTVDRHIISGTLGCPICHAEYPIENGAVDFGGSMPRPALSPDALTEDKALRAGALLGLDERGGLYVLDVIGSHFIQSLLEMSPNSQFIALTANAQMEGAGIVIRSIGDALPLAKGCARGIALDRATPGLLNSAVQVLASGGRLVAPAAAPVPDGISVLASDSEQWVGEREAMPALSSIGRVRR
jgi:uncharacterized protein YbaR (Trm112 family)